MHPKELFEFIEANLDIIEAEKREVDRGDRYWSEQGIEYLVFTKQKDAILVGRVITIEDDDDWAQAESYENYYCTDYYEGHNIDTEVAHQKILNGNYNPK